MENYINTEKATFASVADWAIAYPGALPVFNKYKIDYCCGGRGTLEDACSKAGLDVNQVKREILESGTTSGGHALRPEKWSSSFLIDYIQENHHSYVRQATPEIFQFLEKVCNAHGLDAPELLQIRDLFTELAKELADHMKKEELILFPALKQMDVQDTPTFVRTIQGPIAAMEDEHESAGNLIKAIRVLSNNYTPPDYACPTFKITFKKLQEFDNDLMMHVHLENNVLFSRTKNLSACTVRHN